MPSCMRDLHVSASRQASSSSVVAAVQGSSAPDREIKNADLACARPRRAHAFPLFHADRHTVLIWDTNPHTPRLYFMLTSHTFLSTTTTTYVRYVLRVRTVRDTGRERTSGRGVGGPPPPMWPRRPGGPAQHCRNATATEIERRFSYLLCRPCAHFAPSFAPFLRFYVAGVYAAGVGRCRPAASPQFFQLCTVR